MSKDGNYRYYVSELDKYYWFKNFRVYWGYKEYCHEKRRQHDFNESFTGQFLKAGFETYGISFNESHPSFHLYRKKINPTENWHGTSVYHPDTIFVKGEKQMRMSLQGVSAPLNEKYKELYGSSIGIKYILMTCGEEILYEDWTGNLPPKQLVEEFLK